MAFLADLSGAITAAPLLKLLFGACLMGLAALALSKRWIFRATHWAYGLTILLTGLGIVAAGVVGYIHEKEERRKLAFAETCSAANNFRETYTTGLDGLYAGDWDPADQDVLLKELRKDLSVLSQAASSSDSQLMDEHAHKMRSYMLTAFASSDSAENYKWTASAWVEFRALSRTCGEAGISVPLDSNPSRPATIEAACKAFSELINLGNKLELTAATKGLSEDTQKALNAFKYNALNVQDQTFANDGANFVYALAGKADPKKAIENLRYDCQQNGFPAPSVRKKSR